MHVKPQLNCKVKKKPHALKNNSLLCEITLEQMQQ